MVWPFGATEAAVTGPDAPAPRTARNAIIAALLLLGVLTIGAQSCSGSWTATAVMERYVKLGTRLGPQELERDLLRSYPVGSSIAPLFTYLQRQGFDCGAALEPGRNGECRFRARREDGRVATLAVAVGHDGVQLRALAARMTLGMN